MNNLEIIAKEMEWIEELIENRISHYFDNDIVLREDKRSFKIKGSFYGDFIEKYHLNLEEQKILALALSVHVAPNILDTFFIKNTLYDIPFTEFGGVADKNLNRFTPTVQTALFLLSGDDREKYIENLALFDKQNKLFKKDILSSNSNQNNIIHHQLSLSQTALNWILKGKDIDAQFNASFPATKLTTHYTWEDLVLPHYTKEHLEELD